MLLLHFLGHESFTVEQNDIMILLHISNGRVLQMQKFKISLFGYPRPLSKIPFVSASNIVFDICVCMFCYIFVYGLKFVHATLERGLRTRRVLKWMAFAYLSLEFDRP